MHLGKPSCNAFTFTFAFDLGLLPRQVKLEPGTETAVPSKICKPQPGVSIEHAPIVAPKSPRRAAQRNRGITTDAATASPEVGALVLIKIGM